ncbi:MAG: FliM/FliN family flagellar motor switch protein [Rhizobiales bacterium]|nr:FliM/FliN family flagellar motor switch protein [Hyphomicrobiales bacterium]MBI3674558.1 FliM/FliN family flagellar motor switch protein [Hyphomicrobiales bacterium]
MNDPLGRTLEEESPIDVGAGSAPLDALAPVMPAVAESILQIPLTLQVVIGTTRLPLSRLAELRPGSMVELDQRLGTAAAILVNGREVARGELFVLEGEDSRLGLSITEVFSGERSAGGP